MVDAVSVADRDDEDDQHLIVDLVDDPVVAVAVALGAPDGITDLMSPDDAAVPLSAQGLCQTLAMSNEIASTWAQRLGPRASKKPCRTAWLRPVATHTTRPLSWLAITVR